jgi:hypothetical protein
VSYFRAFYDTAVPRLGDTSCSRTIWGIPRRSTRRQATSGPEGVTNVGIHEIIWKELMFIGVSVVLYDNSTTSVRKGFYIVVLPEVCWDIPLRE